MSSAVPFEAGDMERAKNIPRRDQLDKDFIPAYLGLGEVFLKTR
jgi:hypothetical protein